MKSLFHFYWFNLFYPFSLIFVPLTTPRIKKHAKIASRAIIIGSAAIEKNVIVGAEAVVTKDVPAGKIVAGVLAKIIGDVTEESYFF